jgi:hypothetical protein
MGTTWRSLSGKIGHLPRSVDEDSLQYNQTVKRVILILLTGMLILSLGAFLWSLIPSESYSRTIKFPTELQQVYGGKIVIISMPREIRVGETSQLLVRIEGFTPIGKEPANLYLQAKVDIPGLIAIPEGMIGEQFDDREGARFSWELIPRSTGSFEGTIWIYAYAGDVTKAGVAGGEPIFALPVTIEVQQVLGLPVDVYRWLCLLIAFISAMALVIMAVRRKDQSAENRHKSQD